MIMTGPADRLSWFSTSELVFGCWPIEHMTYRKVSSSRPVYLYSILELFGQSSQYISIKVSLHKPSENLKTCFELGQATVRDFIVCKMGIMNCEWNFFLVNRIVEK